MRNIKVIALRPVCNFWANRTEWIKDKYEYWRIFYSNLIYANNLLCDQARCLTALWLISMLNELEICLCRSGVADVTIYLMLISHLNGVVSTFV